MRVLYVLAFSILSGLFGVGITWLALAFLYVRNHDDRLVKVMPFLLAGGVVGFVIGAVVVTRMIKTDVEAEMVEEKYLGRDSLRIYGGLPLSIFTFCFFNFGDKFLNKLGNTTGAYLGLGLFLVFIAASLVVSNHLPRRLIVPLGIIGWLLTFAILIYFGFFVKPHWN